MDEPPSSSSGDDEGPRRLEAEALPDERLTPNQRNNEVATSDHPPAVQKRKREKDYSKDAFVDAFRCCVVVFQNNTRELDTHGGETQDTNMFFGFGLCLSRTGRDKRSPSPYYFRRG